MLTKTLTEQYVGTYSLIFIKMLELTDYEIHFHVKKSTKLDNSAIVLMGEKDANVTIFYNLQRSKADCVGSIFHELLHIKFKKLSSLVKSKKAYDIEEEIVQNLENVFLAFLKGNVVL